MPQTGFERRRGISGVEIRHGFAQVLVCVPERESARIDALRALAEAGVSHKFLKLIPGGLSCVVPSDKASAAAEALKDLHPEVEDNRSIVLVMSANLRDEEGLLARIVQAGIESEAEIHHMGDMHDRAYMVVETAQAQRVADLIKTRVGE